MRRRSYYRDQNAYRDQGVDNDLRENRSDYQRYNRGSVHHGHPLTWVLVIILCLGIGWFASNHFVNRRIGNVNSPTTNKSERVVKGGSAAPKANRNQPAPRVRSNRTSVVNNRTTSSGNMPNEAEIQRIQVEMSRLGVSSRNQAKADNYFAKQSPKNQAKIIKAIKWANRLVPSETLRRKIITWALR